MPDNKDQEVIDRLYATVEQNGGYKVIYNEAVDAMQDVLDPLFQHRFYAIRKVLREKGWSGEIVGRNLFSENGTSTNFQFDYAGPGKNIVAMNVCGIQDNLDCTPEQFAERIDSLVRTREEFEIVSNYRDGLGYGNDIENPDELKKVVEKLRELGATILELQRENYVYPDKDSIQESSKEQEYPAEDVFMGAVEHIADLLKDLDPGKKEEGDIMLERLMLLAEDHKLVSPGAMINEKDPGAPTPYDVGDLINYVKDNPFTDKQYIESVVLEHGDAMDCYSLSTVEGVDVAKLCLSAEHDGFSGLSEGDVEDFKSRARAYHSDDIMAEDEEDEDHLRAPGM